MSCGEIDWTSFGLGSVLMGLICCIIVLRG